MCKNSDRHKRLEQEIIEAKKKEMSNYFEMEHAKSMYEEHELLKPYNTGSKKTISLKYLGLIIIVISIIGTLILLPIDDFYHGISIASFRLNNGNTLVVS